MGGGCELDFPPRSRPPLNFHARLFTFGVLVVANAILIQSKLKENHAIGFLEKTVPSTANLEISSLSYL